TVDVFGYSVHDFCFFFQAEDGIRGFHVTGVQTCALPISFLITMAEQKSAKYKRILLKLSGEALMGDMDFGIDPKVLDRMALEVRSEERRVGKECRATRLCHHERN